MRNETNDAPVIHHLRTAGFLLIAACSLLSACSNSQKPIAEAPPPAPTSPVEQPQQNLILPPPQTTEVQEAVKRVFKDTVVIDSSHKPSFIVADFNGDRSEDVAVTLEPVPEKIHELNIDFPGWILRDPFGSTEPKSPRLRIAARETLLAVIHGYGPNGWRDSQATQTYLLKNAAGSAMKAYPLKEFAAASQGKSVPRLRGDVVSEVLDGRAGYLYYADATYSWYDPKTFKPEPERRMVHAPPPEVKK